MIPPLLKLLAMQWRRLSTAMQMDGHAARAGNGITKASEAPTAGWGGRARERAHVAAAGREGGDDVAQGAQAAVDVLRLDEPVACAEGC